jgi:hypothetical protein
MKLKACLGICAIFLFSVAAIADEKSKKMEMPPEQKAAMEAMMKAGAPGEEHKKLSNLTGKWNAKVTMWMDPAAPPQVSRGTSTNKWILGGRWVQQTFSGKFMGRPFSGIGYTGYDNIKKQYVSTWMDDMSTAVMVSMGSASDDKTYEFSSTVDDPMTGKPAEVKVKTTVVDDDHHVMEMWGPAPDGKMYKMMEITYSRKKS